jgi:hypothetical protein
MEEKTNLVEKENEKTAAGYKRAAVPQRGIRAQKSRNPW